jgi:hypothetical protein
MLGNRGIEVLYNTGGSAPIRAVLEHQPTSTYPERICRRCNRGVYDEAHWLLKCRALLHIRRKYTTLLRNRRSVDKLMSAMYDRNQLSYRHCELHLGYY